MDSLLLGALPLAALGVWADLDPRCVALLVAGYLHLRVFPRAPNQAVAASDTLDDCHQAIARINRCHTWMVLGTLLLLALEHAVPRGSDGVPMVFVTIASQTPRPGKGTSTSDNGVRVRIDDGPFAVVSQELRLAKLTLGQDWSGIGQESQSTRV
ncbi:MAG: hypothetical protein HY815_30825 [Candidatus Riflebacteria bacterium]|nr:hypothetical protein [Candidatus Riflebacteria bacterium]